MDSFKRILNNDIQILQLSTYLNMIYDSLPGNREPFDTKERFVAVFDESNYLVVKNMREVITQETILSQYNESFLNNIYGNHFKDIFDNCIFTAHTHPLSYIEAHKRPSDEDYQILKEFSFNKPHYIIDESYIYCILFSKDEINGFYGKWDKETLEYISDEHFDLSIRNKLTGEKEIELGLLDNTLNQESTVLYLGNGSFRLETNG